MGPRVPTPSSVMHGGMTLGESLLLSLTSPLSSMGMLGGLDQTSQSEAPGE